MRRVLLSIAVLLAALTFASSPARAYVHEANAEQACANWNWAYADANFRVYGAAYAAAVWWIYPATGWPNMIAPNRTNTHRITVSIGIQGHYVNNYWALGEEYRCTVDSTNGDDSGIYIAANTDYAMFWYAHP